MMSQLLWRTFFVHRAGETVSSKGLSAAEKKLIEMTFSRLEPLKAQQPLSPPQVRADVLFQHAAECGPQVVQPPVKGVDAVTQAVAAEGAKL